MTSPIKLFLQQIHPLSEDVQNKVVDQFEFAELPKGYFLLKSGKICKHLWFMTSGAVRYYYEDENGKERNTWFAFDYDVITDAPSFVKQEPSLEYIQVIEDSQFYAIDNTRVNELLKNHHEFALWYIKLVEKFYICQIEDRIADLQFLDAKQRYEKLLRTIPTITNRISLGQIASYLNVTQETLSRLRSSK